jgi:SIR2-like domain
MNEVDTTKILVFTGAGISKPLGLPTTTDFYESIKPVSPNVTTYAIEYLKENNNGSEMDIELILSTLEELAERTSFAKFISELDQKIIQHVADPNVAWYLGAIIGSAKEEITRIKRIVFDKLMEFNRDNAETLYHGLIEEIRNSFSNSAISFITTNYDLTFEHFCTKSSLEVDFGFSFEKEANKINLNKDFKWYPEKIEYRKIHGSLDWNSQNDTVIKIGAPIIPHNPDQVAIIYPGYKGVPANEPFVSLHTRLYQRLIEADYVIVIGFAFRDAYINSLFENVMRMREDIRILCFNPNDLDEFPEESRLPHFVRHYLNQFKHVQERISIGA